jgi:large subunit ribosomal protein L35
MALQQSANIPFEQLPYQCFQEARKILQADRKEKLKQIEIERAKIARLKAADLGDLTEQQRQNKLLPMQKHLEKLKIWADFNDPIVKRNFEDGKGIYLSVSQ